MSTFLKRLNDEKVELQEKIEKLESFLGTENFNMIDANQQSLLIIQLSSMKTYLDCLRQRLNHLK